jgi:nucleoside-diphosphate-sugar epimerase
MRVCVTGGAGFIGAPLCAALDADGHAPVCIDLHAPAPPPPWPVHLADLRDEAALRAALSGEAIVHLAAVHRDDVRPRSLYEEVNVEGTRRLCRIAAEKGIERIVFASSVAVYGDAPPGADEHTAPRPFNDYGRSKLAAEAVLRDWQAGDPAVRSLVIVRPTVVFGPGNRGNLHLLLDQIAAGRFVMVGDGTNRKSLAHVDNVVAFIVHVLGLGPGVHLFNYADAPDFTMNDLVAFARVRLRGRSGVGLRLPRAAGLALGHAADAISRLSGRSLPVSAVRVRKFTADTAFASAAHALAGFRAPVSLRDGLERMIARDFPRASAVGEQVAMMTIEQHEPGRGEGHRDKHDIER